MGSVPFFQEPQTNKPVTDLEKKNRFRGWHSPDILPSHGLKLPTAGPEKISPQLTLLNIQEPPVELE